MTPNAFMFITGCVLVIASLHGFFVNWIRSEKERVPRTDYIWPCVLGVAAVYSFYLMAVSS